MVTGSTAKDRAENSTSSVSFRLSASMLGHLIRLTRDFERGGQTVSAVRVYAQPAGPEDYDLRPVAASETGFEGVACVDDTARAVVLALDVYDATHEVQALDLARRWLTFVEYMQYPDGTFANFIRDWNGTRNVSAPTSVRGGPWWTGRALWALARAYRATGEPAYLERFRACSVAGDLDCKISGLLALGDIELYSATGGSEDRAVMIARCDRILDASSDSAYFLDQKGNPNVHFWGYHQLEAVARVAHLTGRQDMVQRAVETVDALIEPAIRARFWHAYPERLKDGVCAFDVAPAVRGLTALYRATEQQRFRDLALEAAAWLYGRNDAGVIMYDPRTGRCRDGIMKAVASDNYGAESSIEAGFIQLARASLTHP